MSDAKIRIVGEDVASAVVAGVGRSVGEMTANVLLATKEVQTLKKELAESVSKGQMGSIAAISAQLDDAIPKLKQAESALKNELKPAVEETDSWMSRLGATTVATAAGFVSAQAVMGAVSSGARMLSDVVSSSIASYASAEAAQKTMVVALRAQSMATPDVINQYNQLAAQMQATTVVSDDMTNKMEALLVEIGGVMPSQMEAALKASADLSAGLGLDLAKATELVAKAAAGHTETLGRYGITVSDAALKTQGFGAVLAAVNRQFGGQAEAQLDTYAGRVQQLANNWDNVKEAIGGAILSDSLLQKVMRDLATDTSDANGAFSVLSGSFKVATGAAGLFVSAVVPGAGALLDLVSGLEAAAAAENAWIEVTKKGEAGYKAFIAAHQPFDDVQRVINAGMAESVRLTAADAEAKKKAAAEATRLAAEFVKLKETILSLNITNASAIARQIYDPSAGELPGLAGLKAYVKEYERLAAIDQQMAFRGATGLEKIGQPLDIFGDTTRAADQAVRDTDFVGPMLPKISALRADLDTVFQSIPGTLARAFEGGGNLLGAAESLGSQLGGALGKNIGKTISSLGEMGGPIGMAIGSLAGPLIGMLANIGGPSAAELEGRKIAAAFEQSLGGVDAMMAKVGEAYDATGRSSLQAQADVKALWDAERQGGDAAKAAADKIRAVMAEQLAQQKAVETGVNAVTSAFGQAGARIPDSVRASIDALRTMNGLTDAQRIALGKLTAETRPNFEQLQQTAKNYGIELAGLGPKFEQGRLEDASQKIVNDFKDLKEAGGDVGGVLLGMSDEISKLVQESMQFGTAIPDNMRPLIQNLMDAGKLTDENGNKLADMGAIKFEDTPIQQGIADLVTSIQLLVDTLTNKVPAAAAAAARSVPANPYADWAPPDISLQTPDVPSYANEGFDLTRPQLARVGDATGDSESILHARTVRDIVRAARNAGSSGGGADVVTAVQALAATFSQQIKSLRADLTRQNMLLPIALRDALA